MRARFLLLACRRGNSTLCTPSFMPLAVIYCVYIQ